MSTADLPENLYWRGQTIWGSVRLGGHQYRTSLRTSDPAQAQARYKEWSGRLERRQAGEADYTFKEAVVRWGQDILPNAYKPSAARRYLTSVTMLDRAFGDKMLTDITSKSISDYITLRRREVSNATLRRDLSALSRLLSACNAWGWMTSNPAKAFDRSLLREQPKALVIPTDAELDAVLDACSRPMAKIIRLLAETGMREMEAVNLECSAVDFELRQITLLHTKTGRPRTLKWLTPGGDAGAVLAEHRSEHRFMFVSRDGRPYGQFATSFGKVMSRLIPYMEKTGQPFRRFRVHDLRHRFAIRWLKSGGDIYRLSRHLGHTSVLTTERYLRYLTDEEVDRIMGVRRANVKEAAD
jgi:integrase